MKLTNNEMAYLAQAFTDRTPIGLFSNINAKTQGDEFQTLTASGVIVNGAYSAEAAEILAVISKPERCSRLLVNTDYAIVEKYTYTSGGKFVLAENNDGTMVFSRPQNLSAVIIGLAEFFGMSKLKTSDAYAQLKPDEVTVLVAVIDIYRRNSLLVYAGEKADKTAAVSLQDIKDELSGNFENGIKKLLINNYNFKLPAEADVPGLLDALTEKGALAFDQGYKLKDEFDVLAKNFLIPEALVLIEAMEMRPDGVVEAAGCFCVVAGIHDLISFIFDDDSVEISAISASQMLLSIESFMKCPKIYQPEPVRQAAPAAVAPAAVAPAEAGIWKCACGQINNGNFCRVCGARRPA